jgi:hypothetical protein
MPESRDSQQPQVAKLGILIALAIAGQFIARWIGSRYVTNLSAPAQNASVAIDLILLASVPFGFFLAPRLSLPGTPLLDRWMRREPVGPEFNRTLYRSLVLALISLIAALAVSLLPHARVHTEGINAPIPLAFDILLAIAAALREEIEFRLGLLTVLAWLINQASRALFSGGRTVSLWIANLIQAMAFGALHQIAGFAGRTSTLSLTGVMLEPRTVGGVILGYAYIRYGLESAIMTHALGDALIFVLLTLFAKL